MMESPKQTRRRGTALETAILAATWSELLAKGYADLTLDDVAKRAGTSRPVLHRRWPGKLELVGAALRQHLAHQPREIPDLGSVRADLAELLQKLSERGTPTYTLLMLQLSGYFIEAATSFAELKEQLAGQAGLDIILARGVARGEINPARLTPRVAALPLDLVRHEVMMTLKPASPQTIGEILDEVFLPLVS